MRIDWSALFDLKSGDARAANEVRMTSRGTKQATEDLRFLVALQDQRPDVNVATADKVPWVYRSTGVLAKGGFDGVGTNDRDYTTRLTLMHLATLAYNESVKDSRMSKEEYSKRLAKAARLFRLGTLFAEHDDGVSRTPIEQVKFEDVTAFLIEGLMYDVRTKPPHTTDVAKIDALLGQLKVMGTSLRRIESGATRGDWKAWATKARQWWVHETGTMLQYRMHHSGALFGKAKPANTLEEQAAVAVEIESLLTACRLEHLPHYAAVKKTLDCVSTGIRWNARDYTPHFAHDLAVHDTRESLITTLPDGPRMVDAVYANDPDDRAALLHKVLALKPLALA